MMRFNWKIGGEAGFGIMTTGLVFAKIATRSGYHIFNYQEYPSLIRGGHNTVEVVISDQLIGSPKTEIDLLVCLNKDTYEFHNSRLHNGSVVIYDSDIFQIENVPFRLVSIPFNKIKNEMQVHQQMINTVALGSTLAIMGGELSVFETLLKEQFGKKGQEIIDSNLRLAKLGFDEVINNNYKKFEYFSNKKNSEEKMVLTGNEAFSVGTVAAGCRYFAAYPMTPASSVLGVLAAWQYENGMVVRHPEDELAVINSALGASFAGARSAVSTSGGGFALMVEALSYSGVAEIPIVVYLGMRPGPATGMPTWTEQGDLLFAVHSGHGEFPKIVLAPGDTEEMIYAVQKAFDLADIYQLPVIILADKYICESYRDITYESIKKYLTTRKINRGKIVSESKDPQYMRYRDAVDGVSEMLIPGQAGVYYQANSYEHLEDSHTTESSEERIKQVEKRSRKIENYLSSEVENEKNIWDDPHFKKPEFYGDSEAQIVFVTWGGTKQIVRDAMTILREEYKTNTGQIHFSHIFPMDEKQIQPFFKEDKRYILIENNHTAQFGQLLRMHTGVTLTEKYLKYDGRPFYPEEIVSYITRGYDKMDDRHKAVLEKLQKISTQMEEKN